MYLHVNEASGATNVRNTEVWPAYVRKREHVDSKFYIVIKIKNFRGYACIEVKTFNQIRGGSQFTFIMLGRWMVKNLENL